jgi:hypothetical protein
MTSSAPVVLGVIRDVAIRITIRLALGDYRLQGPQDNILELESRVAWAAVVTELQNEGYRLVSPEEYGATYGLAPAAVGEMVDRHGTLFALVYASGGSAGMVVPLAEREENELLGPMPA